MVSQTEGHCFMGRCSHRYGFSNNKSVVATAAGVVLVVVVISVLFLLFLITMQSHIKSF